VSLWDSYIAARPPLSKTYGQQMHLRPAAMPAGCTLGVQPMLDVLLLAGGLGLFAITVGYAYACDRL
jgi:hypothetical protein